MFEEKLESGIATFLAVADVLWGWGCNHRRFLKACLAVVLAIICIPRGMHGGQNSVLVGWIGLVSLITFVVMGVRSIYYGIKFHEFEPTDHKSVSPDRNDWLADA